VYYNIKIKSNKGEYALESFDKDIIQREMDLYFASMYQASEEFKSKIKEIKLNPDDKATFEEIEKLKTVRESVTEETVNKEQSSVNSNWSQIKNEAINESIDKSQNSIHISSFNNINFKEISPQGFTLNPYFGNNPTENIGEIKTVNNAPLEFKNEIKAESTLENLPKVEPLKEDIESSLIQNATYNLQQNEVLQNEVLQSQPVIENKVVQEFNTQENISNNLENIEEKEIIPELEPIEESLDELINTTDEQSQIQAPNEDLNKINDTKENTKQNNNIQENPLDTLFDIKKPTPEIIFDDTIPDKPVVSIPADHPDIQELNTIMPDIQLEGVNNIPAVNNPNINNAIVEPLSNEIETNIKEEEIFEVNNSTNDSVVAVEETKEETKNNILQEKTEPLIQQNSEKVGLEGMLQSLQSEIDSLDISQSNDIDGNLLAMFEEGENPATIEFSESHLNQYNKKDDIEADVIEFDTDWKSSITPKVEDTPVKQTIQQENNFETLDVISASDGAETIDVTSSIKSYGAENSKTSEDNAYEAEIIEFQTTQIPQEIQPQENQQIETQQIELQPNEVQINKVENDPITESFKIVEPKQSAESIKIGADTVEPEPKSVNNTEVKPIESTPHVIDFKLYLSSFNVTELSDKFLICAFYIKHMLKQNDFAIKFINSKLFPATGEIANMTVVNDLLSKNLIQEIPSDGVHKYSISPYGENYFTENFKS